MHAGNCSQIGAGEERRDILPAHFTGLPQLLQLTLAIDELEVGGAIEGSLHYRFVLLSLQRTCGIDEPPAKRWVAKRGLQDGQLSRLKIAQVFRLEPPLDLWIAGQSASAGTRNVGEDAVKGEGRREGQMTRVRRYDVDVRQASKALQQARAMRMQLDRKYFGARIAPGEQSGLAAGSGATIQNHFSAADQHRDQLRSFILDGDAAFLVSTRAGYIARKNAPRSRQQPARRKLHARRSKFGFTPIFARSILIRLMVVNVNRRGRHRLIVDADSARRLKSIALDPTVD